MKRRTGCVGDVVGEGVPVRGVGIWCDDEEEDESVDDECALRSKNVEDEAADDECTPCGRKTSILIPTSSTLIPAAEVCAGTVL